VETHREGRFADLMTRGTKIDLKLIAVYTSAHSSNLSLVSESPEPYDSTFRTLDFWGMKHAPNGS
jgi:hypothetical protein